MNTLQRLLPSLLFAACLGPSSLLAQTQISSKLSYPSTKKVDQVDDYFGVKVADPYRWLEDENGADTVQWVEAENAVTTAYLDRIPFRPKLKSRLETLYNYPRYSPPVRRGEYFFYSKNDGLQNQSVWYVQKGLSGTPEIMIDPNKLSMDGTSQLREFSLSKDGHYLGYGVSKGGSDWIDVSVMEVSTKKLLPDLLQWVKVSGIAWQSNGFFYSRYPEPAKGKELTSQNENHRVYYHKVGTAQTEDPLIFEDAAHPLRFHIVGTTEDERFAILEVSDRSQGKKGNALYFRDLTNPGNSFTPIFSEIGQDSFQVVDNVGDKFLVMTDRGAPNSRVVLFDPKNPDEKSWKDVLPERAGPLQSASTGGGKLFASWRKDVVTRAYAFNLEGKLENEVELPGLGTASDIGGRADDTFVFYSFTSFNFPPTIYQYDMGTRKSELFRAVAIPEFKPADYETEQVFYHSKDGTRIPMFLVHKKGLVLNGNQPTLLYGYGGFGAVVAPSFSSLRLSILEQGFVYASANIRGGAEYGEKWHDAGTKVNKQNVFDDFIAAAEFLIANKYTSPGRLAISGASNGGLLVGAVANQRPELFKAVIAQAGVMDMLRFHKFTIGWNWIPDYGSVENRPEFETLRAYSPVHNVRAGGDYPATLITTADHDDRVVPAHSYKYAAALQAAQSGARPILIRIDTKSGHGASNTTKAIEQMADIYSFLMENLGVAPSY